jgi:hypothetical protein
MLANPRRREQDPLGLARRQATVAGATGYSHGVFAHDINGTIADLRGLANTNGLGQVTCGATLDTCTTIGSAIKP